MSRKLWLALGVLLVASMVLTACPAPQVQTVEKVVTQVVEKQVEVVKTVEVEKQVEKIVTQVVEVQVTPEAPAGPKVLDICKDQEPDFRDYGAGHYVACWLYQK